MGNFVGQVTSLFYSIACISPKFSGRHEQIQQNWALVDSTENNIGLKNKNAFFSTQKTHSTINNNKFIGLTNKKETQNNISHLNIIYRMNLNMSPFV